jgi:hypothetical protein
VIVVHGSTKKPTTQTTQPENASIRSCQLKIANPRMKSRGQKCSEPMIVSSIARPGVMPSDLCVAMAGMLTGAAGRRLIPIR